MKLSRLPKPGMSLFACAACALGLLLWARLLLVSSPPRVATAAPDGVMVESGAMTQPVVSRTPEEMTPEETLEKEREALRKQKSPFR